jgi:hypothetical protein
MTFVKGHSGNPAGRPIGSRNKAAFIMDAMIEGDSEDLARRVIQKAIGGDTAAMRICLDRVGPRGRDRPLAFPLPTIATPQDARNAADEIGGAIGAGAISAREAMELLRVVDKIVDTRARADAAEAAAAQAAERAQEPQRMTFRWANGQHVATLVRQPDGTFLAETADDTTSA